jgi:hypothetical protein
VATLALSAGQRPKQSNLATKSRFLELVIPLQELKTLKNQD